VRTLKVLAAIAALAIGVHVWHGRHGPTRDMLALADSNGFVPVQMPDGSTRDTVLILAPVNCPSDGAKRGDALSSRLRELGIPNIRSSQYSVSTLTQGNREGVKRAFAVMNGQIPAVMLNGRGKANPTANEVATEYRRDD
jgi:hypothetical protein